MCVIVSNTALAVSLGMKGGRYGMQLSGGLNIPRDAPCGGM